MLDKTRRGRCLNCVHCKIENGWHWSIARCGLLPNSVGGKLLVSATDEPLTKRWLSKRVSPPDCPTYIKKEEETK